MNRNPMLLQLIEPVPRENRRDNLYSLRQFLTTSAKNLDVRFEVGDVDYKGRVTLTIDGEDCNVFESILANTFGIVPNNSENLTDRPFKAFIEKIDLTREELLVDMGINQRCVVGQQSLLSIFGKGKFENLTRLLGLSIAMPLEVSITHIREDTAHLRLSSAQIDKYRSWTQDFLDRIIAVNCTRRRAKNALATTENLRNIVDLERLGFYCQSIICKFSVDTRKIIADLERSLKDCTVRLFSPMEIITSLDLPSRKFLTRLKAHYTDMR